MRPIPAVVAAVCSHVCSVAVADVEGYWSERLRCDAGCLGFVAQSAKRRLRYHLDVFQSAVAGLD